MARALKEVVFGGQTPEFSFLEGCTCKHCVKGSPGARCRLLGHTTCVWWGNKDSAPYILGYGLSLVSHSMERLQDHPCWLLPILSLPSSCFFARSPLLAVHLTTHKAKTSREGRPGLRISNRGVSPMLPGITVLKKLLHE